MRRSRSCVLENTSETYGMGQAHSKCSQSWWPALFVSSPLSHRWPAGKVLFLKPHPQGRQALRDDDSCTSSLGLRPAVRPRAVSTAFHSDWWFQAPALPAGSRGSWLHLRSQLCLVFGAVALAGLARSPSSVSIEPFP